MSKGRRRFWIVLFGLVAAVAGGVALYLHIGPSSQDNTDIAIWGFSEGDKQNLALLFDLIALMFGGLVVLVAYRSKSNLATKGGVMSRSLEPERQGSIHIQGITNIQGIVTLEQYKADLKEGEQEVRKELKQAYAEDREVLETELAAIEGRLADTEASYQDHIRGLEQRIAELETIRGQVPDQLLDEARNALAQGDLSRADELFAQVQAQPEAPMRDVAEAAYQRSRIAQDEIRYRDAYGYAQRAVQLVPEETRYLRSAGRLAKILGKYRAAKDYHERALAMDLEALGEDHPDVARDRNGLGSAWHELGEYQKAIGFYEQALASDLKTYGEDHPEVAIRRNNLGLAWQALGENEKAIGYLEQALASDLKTYGEDHPEVAIRRNNLGMAWKALGEYEKAIGYLEQALAICERRLGIEHPHTRGVRENLEAARAEQDATDAAGREQDV